MTNAESRQPSLYEELNRKAVDALVWLEDGCNDGEVTPDQAYVAKQALFLALSGLLDPEINRLLSASTESKSTLHQEVCVKGNTIAVITVNDRNNVTVHRAPFDKTEMTTRLFHSNGQPGLLRRVREKLHSFGYKTF